MLNPLFCAVRAVSSEFFGMPTPVSVQHPNRTDKFAVRQPAPRLRDLAEPELIT